MDDFSNNTINHFLRSQSDYNLGHLQSEKVSKIQQMPGKTLFNQLLNQNRDSVQIGIEQLEQLATEMQSLRMVSPRCPLI